MNDKSTNIDSQEVAKFALLADNWWDKEGPLKTLHDINPVRLTFIKKYTDLKHKTVLDLGCGGGILSEAMAKLSAHVSGIDAEVTAINTARLHASQEGLSIAYQSCLIEDYTGKSVDIITCMELLEHVPEPQQLIQHCADNLKSGGFLFLSTLNRNLKAYAAAIIAAEYLLNLLPRQTHDYQKFIKPSELSAMLRKAGLEVIALSGMHYQPFSRIASLDTDISINYLMAAVKL